MVNLWPENSPVRVPAACTAMFRRYTAEMNLLIHGVCEAIVATKFVRLNLFLDPLVLFINDTTRFHPYLLLPNLLMGRVVKLLPALDQYHEQIKLWLTYYQTTLPSLHNHADPYLPYQLPLLTLIRIPSHPYPSLLKDNNWDRCCRPQFKSTRDQIHQHHPG